MQWRGLGTDCVIQARAVKEVPPSKWKDERYSRLERRKRKLKLSCTKQPLISSVFPLLNEVEIVIKKNNELKKCFISCMNSANRDESESVTPHNELNEESLHNFLSSLMKTAKENSKKDKLGKRYDSTIKMFSTYLFLIGGRLLYETLQLNLPLPSTTTVLRCLKERGPDIREGEFRTAELKDFLVQNNLPMKIWLSEDATRITGKIQFDSNSNQIVGLVLPVNPNNGCPTTLAFPASSAKVIEEHIKNNVPASLAYVIMAQPLADKAPSFCFCIYGTDNKFKSEDVLARWKRIREETSKSGIEIMGVSSDGDSRLLKCMRFVSKLPENNLERPWFQCNTEPLLVCVQDTVHIGTKFRSKLLKSSNILVVGNKIITVSHLKIVLDRFPKDTHGLTNSDIEPKDKMNFKAVQKICDPRVLTILKDVPESEGTVQYLVLLQRALDSFNSKSLSPTERLYNIWYVVFFLRLWRDWLSDHEMYSVEDNFITYNTYTCVELNAHALITIIERLRDTGNEQYFLPWLFSSQTCESFFRATRSMTSTFSTIVNFSLLDILNRVKRIQFQTDVVKRCSDDSNNCKINFARQDINSKGKIPEILPSKEEINTAVSNAEKSAIIDAQSLGIVTSVNSLVCKLPPVKVNETTLENTQFDSDTEEENIDNDNEFINLDEELREDLSVLSSAGGTNLKDYSLELSDQQIANDNRFVWIKTKTGRKVLIRKSSLCWLITNSDNHLSSDRNKRVQEEAASTSYCPGNTESAEKIGIQREVTLKIGDWAVFKKIKEKGSLIGLVLGFSYLTGTGKNRQYSKSSVPVHAPKKGSRGIGVLCNWYTWNSNGLLIPADIFCHGFYDIKYYFGTINDPDELSLPKDILNLINTIK